MINEKTYRLYLKQLAEEGRVNEIIERCVNLQKYIESLEKDCQRRTYENLFSIETMKQILYKNKED